MRGMIYENDEKRENAEDFTLTIEFNESRKEKLKGRT